MMNKSEFDKELRQCASEDEVIELMLCYIQSSLKCDACAVILYDENSGNLALKREYTKNFDFCPKAAYYELGQGITGNAVQSGKPVIIGDINKELKKDPNAYILSSSQKVRSAIAVPITKGNRIYGAITADSGRTNHFKEADIDKLLTVSPEIGNKLYRLQIDKQNLRKHGEEEKTRNTREIINSLIDESDALGNEEYLLDRVLNLLNLMIPYDACAIFAQKSGENDITLVKSRDLNRQIPIYNLQRSPVGNILKDGTSILEADASSPKMKPEFQNLLEFFNFCSCIATTYEAGGGEKQAIFLFHRQRNQYHFSHLITLLTISVFFSVLRQKQDLNNAIQRFNKQINISELLSGTVHEIKNALMSVVGLSKELKRIFSNPALDLSGSQSLGVDMSENILNTGMRVAKWLNELLATSQIQDRKREEVEINQLIEKTISFLRYKANEKNIHLEFRSGQSKITIITDPNGLLQVLINLILNPIQLLDRGKKIKVETTVESKAELPIIIKVHDNGKGIHQKDLDKIFRSYYSTRGGTGLGLTISKSIINALGGTISVSSSVNYRTTFTVRLPVDSRTS
ncbi:ATP-binding protein [Desulfobacterales bacterium HSG2]|nr:ATP-binding protein [Desulfobacterales bacterium HSG2]